MLIAFVLGVSVNVYKVIERKKKHCLISEGALLSDTYVDSRAPGGSYLGDVNISAILDSFSVSYDKRVRPNYGGECLLLVIIVRVNYIVKSGGSRASPAQVTRGYGPVGSCRMGGSRSISGWLPRYAQHLSRPPFSSQTPSGRCRVGRERSRPIKT